MLVDIFSFTRGHTGHWCGQPSRMAYFHSLAPERARYPFLQVSDGGSWGQIWTTCCAVTDKTTNCYTTQNCLGIKINRDIFKPNNSCFRIFNFKTVETQNINHLHEWTYERPLKAYRYSASLFFSFLLERN